MSSEKVFIIGGTGNIGTRCVLDLVAKNIPVTLFARSPEKVNTLFANHQNLISIVQGDFSDLTPIQEGIKGHTRLLLLVNGFENFAKTKETIARYAYDAGVSQIVDISSFTVNMGWRTCLIAAHHEEAEKAISNIPNRGHFVALRPGRFMSNHTWLAAPLTQGALYDTLDPEEGQGWISTEDIGAVAAVVLSDDINKHGDAVYNLTGEVLSSSQRAQVISRVVGKEIPYRMIPPGVKYEQLMNTGYIPHLLAVDFIDNLNSFANARVTPIIEILLGRKPQTLEEYLTANKSSLH